MTVECKQDVGMNFGLWMTLTKVVFEEQREFTQLEEECARLAMNQRDCQKNVTTL